MELKQAVCELSHGVAIQQKHNFWKQDRESCFQHQQTLQNGVL